MSICFLCGLVDCSRPLKGYEAMPLAIVPEESTQIIRVGPKMTKYDEAKALYTQGLVTCVTEGK